MTDRVHAGPPRLAGRLRELRMLEGAVERAAQGEPSAVFVLGEAGVGKTRLVRAAADDARDRGFEVLWGRCLRFGAVEAVLLPWVVALEGWLTTASAEEREAVLDAVPGAAALLPSLGGATVEDSARLMSVAEAMVARISAGRPTLLVMDDVQWADAASRDALAYLVAGFGGQRQLLLATCRDEGVAAGDPLFGWLADLRRMPSVQEVTLGRLGPDETEAQLTMLLGADPPPGLAGAVHARSGGNPYLSELLTQGVATLDDDQPDDLPDGLPSDLATALLASWHRLKAPAREVLRTLAVGGGPVSLAQLVEVAAVCGLEPSEVRGSVVEAVAAGTIVPVDGGLLWLRHPLLAEVLYETYLPGEADPVHRAWATTLASGSPPTGAAALRRLGDLALHHERAGDLDAAFLASLEAADGARAQRLWQEEPVHLERAARLWLRVSADARRGVDEGDLLERAAKASERVGQMRAAVDLGGRALELARRRGDALGTSRLMRWCADADWWLGEIEDEPIAVAREAVELSRAFPDSQEHAEALGSLADGLAWEGRWREAGQVAEEAVATARRSGSREALAATLGVRSVVGWEHGGGEADSREGLRQAELSGDPERIQWGAQWRVNVLLATGRLDEATALTRWALEAALESGALAAAVWHAGTCGHLLAERGRLVEAASAVRTGLSLTGVGNGAAALRLAAVTVAVRRGDLAAAELHLRRAEEQIPSLRIRPGLEAPPAIAELLLAQRRPGEALVLLISTMSAHLMDPQVTDLMTVWGVRAAADLVEGCRDRRDRHAVRQARGLLYRLTRGRDRLPGTPFAPPGPDNPVLLALRAVRDAEVARFDGRVAPDLWAEAVRRCGLAGLGWEQQRANVRWASALLVSGAGRSQARAPLREAAGFAAREGAAAMLRDVEAVARASRLTLDEPVPLPRQREASAISGLTAREREVLSHLVAGRTYAEIAAALFISEKTVSTHVSHVLRKTGTSSRQQVSAMALRLLAPDQP